MNVTDRAKSTMSEGQIGEATSQSCRTARGPDRCEKCRSQHVKCNGIRPVCKRCHEKGYTCVYRPRNSPWTVYTNASITDDATTLSQTQRANVLSTQLNSSVDALPRRWNWSDVQVDVHALMHYFFPIDAGFVPSGYLKEIASSFDLVASYAILPALYQSILKRKFETDPAVLSLRSNVLQSINAALRKTDSQTDDSTIISIKHQLYYDCFISSKATILAHLDGLCRIVHIRGGLHTLGLRGDLAHMLKVHTLMAYIITECQPPSEYLQYKTHCSTAVETITPVSLEYCPIIPRQGHYPVTTSGENPQAMLHRLVYLLQQLTDSFLHPGRSPNEQQEQCYVQILKSPFVTQISCDSPMAWIYESCRLAGIIFATAIRYCIPLSHAVTRAAPESDGVSLIDDLCRAIYHSPYSSQPFWGDLAGCFLWVSLVSASLSYCGIHVDYAQDDLYWSTKSRRASLAVPLSFATKLFHAERSSDQAFRITETMILIQEKLRTGANTVEELR